MTTQNNKTDAQIFDQYLDAVRKENDLFLDTMTASLLEYGAKLESAIKDVKAEMAADSKQQDAQKADSLKDKIAKL